MVCASHGSTSHVVVLCARLFRVLSYSEPHPSKLPAFPSRKHDRKSGTPQNRLHRCKNNGVCNARSSVSDLRVDPPTPPTAPSGCAARLDPPTAQSRQALATGLGNAACGFVALRDDPTFVWDHTPSRARACSRARGPSRPPSERGERIEGWGLRGMRAWDRVLGEPRWQSRAKHTPSGQRLARYGSSLEHC